MTKLTNKEIAEQQYMDGESQEITIPKDANSVFKFEVKENVKDIIHNIKEGAQQKTYSYIGHDGSYNEYSEKRWDLKRTEDGDMYLIDPNWNNSYATVKSTLKGIEIETATGHYTYSITQNENQGCTVEFNGPVNGLLNQNLLPKMTYVPKTLEGKFVSKNGADLTPYNSIDTYGLLRDIKNGKQGNIQDDYGFNINRNFNNEIPFLPSSLSHQALKLKLSQKMFENNAKEQYLSEKKEAIRKRLKENSDAEISGVVKADRIAENIIAGSNKQTVSPAVAQKIISNKIKNH